MSKQWGARDRDRSRAYGRGGRGTDFSGANGLTNGQVSDAQILRFLRGGARTRGQVLGKLGDIHPRDQAKINRRIDAVINKNRQGKKS